MFGALPLAASALVHVQNCTTGVFHTAWFGKKSFLMQPSSAQSMGICSQRNNKASAVLTPKWRYAENMREQN